MFDGFRSQYVIPFECKNLKIPEKNVHKRNHFLDAPRGSVKQVRKGAYNKAITRS